MAEMTAETKAFFAREDVLAFVGGVRRWLPGASFGAPEAHEQPGDDLPPRVLVWLGSRGVIADTVIDPEFLADFIGESSSFVSWVDASERLRALREGRALIEDSGSDEAGGSTRKDEQADGSAPEEAAQTPAPSRPVCACGQTVWNGALGYDGAPVCSDCVGDQARFFCGVESADLDTRIAAARKADPDPTDEWRAWATPSAEGVEW